jgi:hypothetical protein
MIVSAPCLKVDRSFGALVMVIIGCALTGCTSPGSTAPPASSGSDVVRSSSATLPIDASPAAEPTYATPAEAATATCTAFAIFYTDLLTYTPHDVARLIPELTPIQHAATQAVEGDEQWRQLSDDTDALVGYVGSADFPTNGNALGQPIQAMQDDCP